MLTTLLASCAQSLQNKCTHTSYSIIAPTLIAHINKHLRSQVLKYNFVQIVTLDALQVPLLPYPHWFLGA